MRVRRWSVPGYPAAFLVLLVGCSEATRSNSRNYAQPSKDAMSEDFAPAASSTPPAPGAAPGSPAPGVPIPPAIPRKIIYNAQVELVVESVASTAEALSRLIKENGGYLSDSDVQSYSHMQQQATWKVRVPVERFDAFLAAVARLGELQKRHLDSQDVTQEFYDLEARIANKQEEEKRLIKHLADSTGKLEDILAVERELSRVRGEVEQMQGRLRYLANVSALSTVAITATEVKDYVPPVSPDFGTRIARTFRESVERLAEFIQGVVIVVVAATPWIPVVAALVLPLWWALRRRRSRRGA
jgi:hypothetical protein